MSSLSKALILIVAIMLIGFGLVVWKNKVGGAGHVSYNSISRQEIELLLSDLKASNPMMLKRLAEDDEMKKQQLKSLKQMFAFASQAVKEGAKDDPSSRQELQSIRSEVIAVSYDREMNKDKGPMPSFGFITEDMINEFWASSPQSPETGFLANVKKTLGLGGDVDVRDREQQFNDFLTSKLDIMKRGNPEMADREISEEERKQARDIFAKVSIYREEYDRRSAAGELDANFVAKTDLQAKLQQVQFLARQYAEKAEEKMKVTDEEITEWIAKNPQHSPDAKRAKAQEILDRAKAGEDFAKLADEFTEDPGNSNPTNGEKNGGIYKDVPKGRMVAPFEAAALALEPGQVAPELVETDFGFHIVKLERKLSPSQTKKDKDTPGVPDGDTYDVRHILISTGVKDPDDPTGREMPIKEFARTKLQEEREKELIDDLVASNGVSVPDDFTVPEVTDEEIQQMRQKQAPPMQMPQPEGDDGHGHDGNGAKPKGKDAPKAPAKK